MDSSNTKMPEGAWWPVWDDGTPVDVVPPFELEGRQVCRLTYDGSMWFLVDDEGECVKSLAAGETLARETAEE